MQRRTKIPEHEHETGSLNMRKVPVEYLDRLHILSARRRETLNTIVNLALKIGIPALEKQDEDRRMVTP